MKIKLVSLMACALALAACTQDDQNTTAQTGTPAATTPAAATPAEVKPALPPAPTAPAGSRKVLTPVGEGKGVPMRLGPGETASSGVSLTEDATLLALGVFIGNSRGTSDGSLTLNLCQDTDCQDVTVPLAGTNDNDFLIFNLLRPVTVTAGQALTYKLVRGSDAINKVAIWTYEPTQGAVALTGPSGEEEGRMAKIVVYLQ